MAPQQNKPDKAIIRSTKITVYYDFKKEERRKWARKINAKLTKKNFELIEYEPGLAIYKKTKYLLPKNKSLEKPGEE